MHGRMGMAAGVGSNRAARMACAVCTEEGEGEGPRPWRGRGRPQVKIVHAVGLGIGRAATACSWPGTGTGRLLLQRALPGRGAAGPELD